MTDTKGEKCKTVLLGTILLFAMFLALTGFVGRTAAQTPLVDDSPAQYGAPVPDDYEFEVLASSHTVVGIRPDPGDNFDIEVYTNTTFTTMIDSSTLGGAVVDFVFLNGTEWASPPNRSASVTSGAANYVIEMENDVPVQSLGSSWNSSIDTPGGIAEVFDVFELNGAIVDEVYTIYLVVPAGADLNMFILNSTGDRSDSIASSVKAGSGVNESLSFTARNAEYHILVITNENGGSGNYTVKVNNPPVVNVSANQTIDEGQTVYVSGNFTDMDMHDTFDYVWNFGDGYTVSGTVSGTGNLLANGSFSSGLNGWNVSIEAPATTTIQVIPSDGPFDNVLDIDNPISDADGDWDWAYQNINLNVTNYSSLYFEADAKPIYQSLSDDGSVGGEYPVHFSIRYQDIFGVWHNGVWTDNPWQRGFYYSGTGSYSYSNKVPQNVWFHYKPSNLIELNPKPRIIDRVKVGSSGWAYHGMIDNVKLYGFDNTSMTIPANHTYGDNGVFNATLTVTDSLGGSASDSLVVTVNNVAPSPLPLLPVTIDEGQDAVFNARATDPGSDDVTFSWNWGYSGFPDTVNIDLNAPPNPDPFPSTDVNPRDIASGANQAYGDNGVFNMTLNVTDDDGDFNATTTTITVNNLAPTGTIGGPYSGFIGVPLDFTGSGNDPGSDDISFTWSWDDGSSDSTATYFNDGTSPDLDPSPAGPYPYSAVDNVQHLFDSPGEFNVSMTIADDDGGSIVYSTMVTITSSPPTIDNVTAEPSPQVVNYEVTISANVNDPDTDVGELTVTVRISDPDGNPVGNFSMTYDATADLFEYSSNFGIEGTYTFAILAIDPEGNSDEAEGEFVMISESPHPEFNWKPIIALIFTIVLLLAGFVAAIRRPVKFSGILKRDRRNTFLLGVLPFAIAEMVTGIVSALTGALAIPPIIGVGLAVDLAILIAGLLAAVIILKKGVSPETYVVVSEDVEESSGLPPPPPGEVTGEQQAPSSDYVPQEPPAPEENAGGGPAQPPPGEL
jgi:hypothetical protein